MLTHLENGKVIDDRERPHGTTNQFHFDTFKLNAYLTKLCRQRGVQFGEGIVTKIERDAESGNITSIFTDTHLKCSADFYVDASGFNRVLMSKLVDNDNCLLYTSPSPRD